VPHGQFEWEVTPRIKYAGIQHIFHYFFLFRRRWPSSAFKISFGKGVSKSSAILIVSP